MTSEPFCIPESQRRIHVASEVFAVAVLAPLMIGIGAGDERLSSAERSFLLVVGIGTLALDGFLLFRFFLAPRPKGPHS